MSKISDAMVDTLLDEITDYQEVRLTPEQLTTLKQDCENWEDKESIESEINEYLQEIGYVFDVHTCMWKEPKTRVVEMYVGVGTGNGDCGTWGTTYVDIPIDTPENEIEEVAKDILRNDEKIVSFAFAGIYHLPALDDQPY